VQSKYLLNISKKGLFTIPIEIRRKFGLKKGMKLNACVKNGNLFFEFPKIQTSKLV